MHNRIGQFDVDILDGLRETADPDIIEVRTVFRNALHAWICWLSNFHLN